jgi:hypothetical protein
MMNWEGTCETLIRRRASLICAQILNRGRNLSARGLVVEPANKKGGVFSTPPFTRTRYFLLLPFA